VTEDFNCKMQRIRVSKKNLKQEQAKRVFFFQIGLKWMKRREDEREKDQERLVDKSGARRASATL
jgi:hypothetical protein